MDSLINKKSMIKVLTPLAISLASIGSMGCNSSEESIFRSGTSEEKPTSELTEKAGRILGATSGDADARKVASATYGIRLKSNSGARLCEGEVEFQIMSNFTLNFPQAEVRCLSMKINLGGILASVSAGASEDGGLKSDGKLISIKKIAGAEFTPPRPVLLGPIIQDIKKYTGMNMVTDHTVIAKDSKGATIKSNGSFRVEVINEKTTYSNKYITKPFENILHWQISTNGFENVPSQNGLLFRKVEWFFNTRPIMIPQINIVGDLGSFLQDGENGVGALVGEFEINLIVMKHNTD